MKPLAYIGEVIENDGINSVEVSSEMIRQMGWSEELLLEMIIEEELENIDA